jgi:hypothetical protein
VSFPVGGSISVGSRGFYFRAFESVKQTKRKSPYQERGLQDKKRYKRDYAWRRALANGFKYFNGVFLAYSTSWLSTGGNLDSRVRLVNQEVYLAIRAFSYPLVHILGYHCVSI